MTNPLPFRRRTDPVQIGGPIVPLVRTSEDVVVAVSLVPVQKLGTTSPGGQILRPSPRQNPHKKDLIAGGKMSPTSGLL